jgi:hypothetical protein
MINTSNIPPDDQNFVTGFYKETVKNNEIVFDRSQDECFVFLQGFGKNAKYVVAEILEISIMTHKLLRNRKFYFKARLRLLKQQFFVVIRKLIRIKKFNNFDPQVSLTIMDCSDWSYWINTISEDRIFLFRDQKLKRLLPQKLNQKFESLLHLKRSDIDGMQIVLGEHQAGDIFIIMNKSLSQSINEKKIENMLNSINSKNISLDEICHNIVNEAKKRRVAESYGIFITKVLRNNPK